MGRYGPGGRQRISAASDISSIRTAPQLYSFGGEPWVGYDPDSEYVNIDDDPLLMDFANEQQQLYTPRGDTYYSAPVGYWPETLKEKTLRILALRGSESSEDEHYKENKAKRREHVMYQIQTQITEEKRSINQEGKQVLKLVIQNISTKLRKKMWSSSERIEETDSSSESDYQKKKKVKKQRESKKHHEKTSESESGGEHNLTPHTGF